MKLSERAVLTSLHVGAWSGNAFDSEVSVEISDQKKASKTAGRYNKRLVDASLLRGVNGAISLARKTHQTLTLPWANDARILSTQGYTKYVTQMRTCRQDVEIEIEKVMTLYPTYKESEANMKRLGQMYNVEDYPSVEALRKKFYMDVEIRPVPESGDFRAQLSEASIEAVTRDIERRGEERAKAAVNDVFMRVADATEHMVERLRAFKQDNGRAENIFRDSLVTNIKELVDLLPLLNITEDQRIERLQQQMSEQLLEHSPDALRGNDRLRNKTAEKAEAIAKRVRGFMA